MGFPIFIIVSFNFQITTVATYMIHICVYVCVCRRKRYKDETKEKKAVTIQDEQFKNSRLHSSLLRTLRSAWFYFSAFLWANLKARKNNEGEAFDPPLL